MKKTPPKKTVEEGGGGERREVSLFFPPNVPLLGIYIREETVSVLVCEVAFLV